MEPQQNGIQFPGDSVKLISSSFWDPNKKTHSLQTTFNKYNCSQGSNYNNLVLFLMMDWRLTLTYINCFVLVSTRCVQYVAIKQLRDTITGMFCDKSNLREICTEGPISNKTIVVQTMPRCRSGDKMWSEHVMPNPSTHIMRHPASMG